MQEIRPVVFTQYSRHCIDACAWRLCDLKIIPGNASPDGTGYRSRFSLVRDHLSGSFCPFAAQGPTIANGGIKKNALDFPRSGAFSRFTNECWRRPRSGRTHSRRSGRLRRYNRCRCPMRCSLSVLYYIIIVTRIYKRNVNKKQSARKNMS